MWTQFSLWLVVLTESNYAVTIQPVAEYFLVIRGMLWIFTVYIEVSMYLSCFSPVTYFDYPVF